MVITLDKIMQERNLTERYGPLKQFADTTLLRTGFFGDMIERTGNSSKELRRGKGVEAYMALSRIKLGEAIGKIYFELGLCFWEIADALGDLSNQRLTEEDNPTTSLTYLNFGRQFS
jgi:hypothetical protein